MEAGVLIIGAGGLGCPAALALGAGGARRIGIIDDDRVDASNLHRQVLFSDADVGEPVAAYDVVIDGSDNFATKFLANDAAVLARRPLVHGAAVGTGGQLVTVPAGGRPCYRCLFEEPPPAGVGPSCAEAGVLGPVPGVIGGLAGVEASRLLRGQAPAYVGRLLQYDSTGMSLRAVSFNPNPRCAVCAADARIHALAADDYPAANCAVL